MSLKVKFFCFILLIHGIIGYLMYQLLGEERRLWFFLVEVGILVSIFLSYLLYKQLIRPIELMAMGANAIEDGDFNVKFVKTGSIEMDQLIQVYNKMINNIREERTQTQEQHYFMEQLLNVTPSAILILDYDKRLTHANPAALALLPLQNRLGAELHTVQHPIVQACQQLALNEFMVIQPDGLSQYKITCRQFLDKGFKRLFYVINDLSKEMLETEKRAYEKVIRMMAHEVNNSIGAVNSIMDISIDYQSSLADESARDITHSLIIAKERNQRLNQFMRNFADIIRLPAPTKRPVILPTFLQDMAQLMTAAANQKGIQLQLYLLPVHHRTIPIDRQQLELVFVNIIKNAIEAIAEKGVIRISTTSNSVLVQDNGKGISPEKAAQLFTPFYSDKMQGQGIGLTLSKEILINHGFTFSLQTQEEWTTFEIGM